jgi:F0F1-type ATP synthase assembly protein I
MRREERREKIKFYRNLYDATTIGLNVVFSILIGGLFGYWLDRKYNSPYHWLLFLFLFFGIVAGFRSMFHGIRKQSKNEDNDKKA